MGNANNSKLKDDRHLEITEKLVREFQEQVTLVDFSMSGLVKTLDSLRLSSELYLRQVDSREESSSDSKDKDVKSEVVDAAEVAVRLLKTIHDSVSDQKKSAVESITKLLHGVINTGMRFLDVSVEDLTLSLDEYLTEQNEVDDFTDEYRPYHETRIELLRKELKLAKKLNVCHNDQIAVLNKKNETFKKEIDVLRRRNEVLEDEKRDITEEKAKIKEEKHSLEVSYKTVVQEKENLNKRLNTESAELETSNGHDGACISRRNIPVTEIEIHRGSHPGDVNDNTEIEKYKKELKTVILLKESLESEMKKIKSKECIHVQTIDRTNRITPTSQFISAFKSKVDTPSSQLYIIDQTDAGKVEPEIPLIVFFNPINGLEHTALQALKDINGLQRVALVAWHKLDNHSSIRASDHVLLNKKIKQLGGIFDVAYNHQNGYYECDVNTRNINGVVDFIKRKGVRLSALETYGLC